MFVSNSSGDDKKSFSIINESNSNTDATTSKVKEIQPYVPAIPAYINEDDKKPRHFVSTTPKILMSDLMRNDHVVRDDKYPIMEIKKPIDSEFFLQAINSPNLGEGVLTKRVLLFILKEYEGFYTILNSHPEIYVTDSTSTKSIEEMLELVQCDILHNVFIKNTGDNHKYKLLGYCDCGEIENKKVAFLEIKL